MNYSITLRLIVIIFAAHASTNGLSQNTDSLKCWCANERLEWDDFKGKVPEDEYSSNLRALTAYRFVPLRIEKNGMLGYRIQLVFKKYESWKTDTASDLLAHERLHFDIAELSARKLRNGIQHIMVTVPNPKPQDFALLIQKLYAEDADMQTAYDDDTIHGIDAQSQAWWEEKVCSELNKLKSFESTSKDCK